MTGSCCFSNFSGLVWTETSDAFRMHQMQRSRENFPVDRLFKFLLQSENELLVSEMKKKKKLGVTDFVSEIKRVENYPDFEKLPHVIEHGLQGFILKNIEGESTEANYLSHIL